MLTTLTSNKGNENRTTDRPTERTNVRKKKSATTQNVVNGIENISSYSDGGNGVVVFTSCETIPQTYIHKCNTNKHSSQSNLNWRRILQLTCTQTQTNTLTPDHRNKTSDKMVDRSGMLGCFAILLLLLLFYLFILGIVLRLLDSNHMRAEATSHFTFAYAMCFFFTRDYIRVCVVDTRHTFDTDSMSLYYYILNEYLYTFWMCVRDNGWYIKLEIWRCND